MGKKQHSKDRLYMTASEWQQSAAGYKNKKEYTMGKVRRGSSARVATPSRLGSGC